MSVVETPGPFWLSILIPVYKVEAYLDQCLSSIIEQADAGVEIILCDDASPDGSGAIAQRYVDAHPQQVRMIRLAQNSGISVGRNAMLELAQGEYIWFFDSDDWLNPGAIAAVAEVVRSHRPDLIGCDYRRKASRKSGFSGPTEQLLTDRDLFVGGICASRKMYAWLRISRRALWDDGLRFPVGRVFEDAAVTPWLALAARSYFHIDKPLVEYRVRGDSIVAGVKNLRQPFDLASHLDLAEALQGFPEALDREAEPLPQTRKGISHFIAMEFAKTAERIFRTRTYGDKGAVRDLVTRFRERMEQSSPIPFAQMLEDYARRGRVIAWLRLRFALALSDD
ncbi:MAG: glycosyltransferase [Porphyrobacter sp.]|jgi:glycosyltransferase involved in cell wall biosynthesis|nr:glycosyltransferase [Porphyrobacter sp.]